MNSKLTGVVSSGVVMGVQALLSFTPLPKSKSQIFTGDTWADRWRKNIMLLYLMPLGTVNVLLRAPCPLKVTYSISVFTKDVLQLKVSVGNACRKAHYHHDEMKTKNKNSYSLWTFIRKLFGCWPTFSVEEVQSLGNVSDHLTGLQLIKVLPVLDVSKNGAWRKRRQSLVAISVS